MPEKIFYNRWFAWTVVLVVILSISLWGFIEYTSIEFEIQAIENSLIFIVVIHKSQSQIDGTVPEPEVQN